jgi:hypothetical protein
MRYIDIQTDSAYTFFGRFFMAADPKTRRVWGLFPGKKLTKYVLFMRIHRRYVLVKGGGDRSGIITFGEN